MRAITHKLGSPAAMRLEPSLNPPDEETGPDCPVCGTEDAKVLESQKGRQNGGWWYYKAQCSNPECKHVWEDDNI